MKTRFSNLHAVALITMTGLPGVADPIIPAPHTTVYVEPVREDGTIDYVGIINARGMEIDPADNAAVVIAALMGHRWPNDQYRDLALSMLGWTEADPGLSVHNPHWILECSFDEGWWREPEAIAWMDANAAPMNAFRDAPQNYGNLYWPFIDEEHLDRPIGIYVLLPQLGMLRDWSRLLCGRAQLRIESGAFREAWQDLKGVFAWGDKVSDPGEVIITSLVRTSLKALALLNVERLMNEAPVDVLEEIRRDWGQFEDFDGRTEMIEGERLGGLDVWQNFVTGHLDFDDLSRMGSLDARMPEDRFDPIDFTVSPIFDPNLGFIRLNRMYDTIQAIGRFSDLNRRNDRANQFDDDNHAIHQDMSRKSLLAMYGSMASGVALPGADQALSEVVTSILSPAFGSLNRIHTELECKMALMDLAVSQEIYSRRQGTYAQDWQALINDGILDQVPRDPFDGQTARIRVTDRRDGLVIYYVNYDLDDDGGKLEPHEDDPDDLGDLAIRVGGMESQNSD